MEEIFDLDVSEQPMEKNENQQLEQLFDQLFDK